MHALGDSHSLCLGVWKVSQSRRLLSRVSNNLSVLCLTIGYALALEISKHFTTARFSTSFPTKQLFPFLFQRLNTSQSLSDFFSVIHHFSLDTFSLASKSLFIFSWVLHTLARYVAIYLLYAAFSLITISLRR